jgi:hypothetical protein
LIQSTDSIEFCRQFAPTNLVIRPMRRPSATELEGIALFAAWLAAFSFGPS